MGGAPEGIVDHQATALHTLQLRAGWPVLLPSVVFVCNFVFPRTDGYYTVCAT